MLKHMLQHRSVLEISCQVKKAVTKEPTSYYLIYMTCLEKASLGGLKVD